MRMVAGSCKKAAVVFLFGCMIGGTISTALYAWLTGAVLQPGNRGLQPQTGRNLRDRSLGTPVKVLGRPGTLEKEYKMRKTILGAVLTTVDRLDYAASTVNATWGPTLARYKIFVKSDSNIPARLNDNFPIVKLGLKEDASDLEEMFSLLKNLYAHHLEAYDWFLLVSDKTYVAGSELEWMLLHLDPQKLVYMGRAVNTKDFRLRMLANEYYCKSGPGIVLSNAALRAIVPHLDLCMALVRGYSKKRYVFPSHPDLELGRCFSRKLGVHCSTSMKAQQYFVHDGKNESSQPERLWYSPVFQEMLTLYPVHSAQHMWRIHHFCKTRRFEDLKRKLFIAEKSANSACRQSLQFSTPSTEKSSKECDLRAFNDYECQSSPVSSDIPLPFSPTNRYELQPFTFLDSRAVFTSRTTIPTADIQGEMEEELQYIVKKTVDIINSKEATEYKFQKISNAYLRYSATRGREYILDLVLSHKQKVLQRRMHLLRPHQPRLVVLQDASEDSRKARVNFIVPVSHVNKRFKEFLLMYENLCLKTMENTRLVLAVFGKEDLGFVKRSVMKVANNYPDFQFQIISSDVKFSRARALDLGMSMLSATELAFLCDVDMTVDQGFLSRCRMNTIRGKRVYYPEFFKYYNMDYVYRFRKPPKTFAIMRQHGHWAVYSFGMLCIYKSDYTAAGGLDTAIVGWGGEDVDLFERIIKQKLEVLKAPDPALSHRYHDKQCSANLQPLQFASCLTSREENLADRMQLAEYVFYLEEKYEVTQRKLWL